MWNGKLSINWIFDSQVSVVFWAVGANTRTRWSKEVVFLPWLFKLSHKDGRLWHDLILHIVQEFLRSLREVPTRSWYFRSIRIYQSIHTNESFRARPKLFWVLALIKWLINWERPLSYRNLLITRVCLYTFYRWKPSNFALKHDLFFIIPTLNL